MLLRSIVMVACIVLCPTLGRAQEANAQKAAETILRAFSDQKFKTVWNDMVSDWGHRNWTEDGFISSMAIQRPMLGPMKSLYVVGRNHYTHDPSTNVDGDIYVITFKTTYTSGEFYENVVVIRDADGQYRLSGLWGAPVPRQ